MKIAAGLIVALVVALLAACGATPTVWACATTDRPPIVVADTQCPNAHEDDPPEGATARWYSAPQSDIGPDDVPVIGEPLDGDFYDIADRLDLDEKAKSSTKKTTTKKPRPSRSS